MFEMSFRVDDDKGWGRDIDINALLPLLRAHGMPQFADEIAGILQECDSRLNEVFEKISAFLHESEGQSGR